MEGGQRLGEVGWGWSVEKGWETNSRPPSIPSQALGANGHSHGALLAPLPDRPCVCVGLYHTSLHISKSHIRKLSFQSWLRSRNR